MRSNTYSYTICIRLYDIYCTINISSIACIVVEHMTTVWTKALVQKHH